MNLATLLTVSNQRSAPNLFLNFLHEVNQAKKEEWVTGDMKEQTKLTRLKVELVDAARKYYADKSPLREIVLPSIPLNPEIADRFFAHSKPVLKEATMLSRDVDTLIHYFFAEKIPPMVEMLWMTGRTREAVEATEVPLDRILEALVKAEELSPSDPLALPRSLDYLVVLLEKRQNPGEESSYVLEDADGKGLRVDIDAAQLALIKLQNKENFWA